MQLLISNITWESKNFKPNIFKTSIKYKKEELDLRKDDNIHKQQSFLRIKDKKFILQN